MSATHAHRWLVVDTHWLYYCHDGYGGGMYWAPVALRDRITHKVYPLVPNLPQALAEWGFSCARTSFGKGI